MTHAIAGYGEIGKAIHAIFKDDSGTIIDSQFSSVKGTCDILHIAFPYSESFIEEVKRYQTLLTPKHTIIHSTVPVGTSRVCNALHSPVIGIHPHLETSMRTFTKFIAGEGANEVADIFRKAGIKVYLFEQSETTELLKILDTTFYGLCVEYTKDVKKQCTDRNLPFEAWTIWTENYNRGYEKLGYPEYVRPNLVPIMREIGGHCVIPNLKLLDTEFTRFLKKL